MTKHTNHLLRSAAVSLCMVLSVCCMPAQAQQTQPAEFIAREPGSSAWVNRVFPDGGEYIYTAHGAGGQAHIDRQTTRAFTLDQVPRQHFNFFSIQEEEALWLVREEQLAAINKEEQTRAKQRPLKNKTASLHWPKVIVEKAQVCVPKIEKAEANDWREHLLCWTMAAQSMTTEEGRHE